MTPNVVTVFGSALPRPGEPAYERARELGRGLAGAGFRLCNGGYGGTMAATAQGAREVSGSPSGTIGVTCELFTGREANPWIDDVRPAATLFERLEMLIALGDAYVVLPGGTGTLLELAAVLELIGKRLLRARPVVLLGGYWEEILRRTEAPVGSPVTVVADVRQCIAHLTRALRGGNTG